MNADVVIVGAGPAGIFTALEMIKKGSKQKIIMVEKGQPGLSPSASCLSAMRWAATCPR